MTLTAVALGVTYIDHAPVIPLLASEFSLSDVGSGLLSTALFTTSVVTMLLGGAFADRYGAKRMLTVALAIALAGNVGFALAPSYAWLLAAKAVGGLAAGFGFLAGLRYVTALYRGDRSHFGQGVYGGGYPLGNALAVWSMAPLAVAFGWRAAFWISSAFIALVLLAWLGVPDRRTARREESVARALGCRNCWLTSLQHAAGFGLALAAGTWITVYLLREFGLPLELSGILGSLLLAMTIAARPFGGWLVSREHVPGRATMRLSQLAIVAGLVLLALPGRPLAVAIAGALAVGLGVGLPYAAVFDLAAASLPRAPGSAQGLTAAGGTVGALVGAPLMGYAVQTVGFWAAWAILGVMSAIAFAATFAMRGEAELARAEYPPVG